MMLDMKHLDDNKDKANLSDNMLTVAIPNNQNLAAAVRGVEVNI
jgi:hypothetical protein